MIALAVFLADRALKILVAQTMFVGESIPVLPPFLHITYILNSGAAFGVLRHGTPIFIAVASILLIGVLTVTIRRPTLSGGCVWGLGLLAGGASGNLWDRVVSGRVIDYIHFRFFAIFNLADSAIVIGMGLLMIEAWRRDKSNE